MKFLILFVVAMMNSASYQKTMKNDIKPTIWGKY